MKLNKFFHHKINAIGDGGGGGGETAQSCADKGADFNSDTGMCVAHDTTGDIAKAAGTGTIADTALTLEQIREQLAAWDATFATQYGEGTPEYIAAQQQARAQFAKAATDNPAITFSQEVFAEAVGLTPAEAIAQYYNYDFTDKDPLELDYTDDITTYISNFVPPTGGQASVFDDANRSWVPQLTTLADVQVPTNYERLNPAELAAYAPTDPTRDVTKVSQSSPAFSSLDVNPDPTFFDAINFPEKDIVRGTPVVSRGLDADGNPTTGITMGETTATGSGQDIGGLSTNIQFPSGGMGINADGTGGNVVGTLSTTGNIVDTDTDVTGIKTLKNDQTTTSTVDAAATVSDDQTVDTSCPVVDGVQWVRNIETDTCEAPAVTVTEVVVANTPNNIKCYNNAGQSQTVTGTLDADGNAIPKADIACPVDFPLRTAPTTPLNCPVGQVKDSNGLCVPEETLTCYAQSGASRTVTGPNNEVTCPTDFPYDSACTNGSGDIVARQADGTCPVDSAETIVCYPDDGGDAFDHEGTTCPTGSSLTAPADTETIVCYPDDGGDAFDHEGATCPTGSSPTAPTETIVCYPDDGGDAFDHEGATCPAGSSPTPTEIFTISTITCYNNDTGEAQEITGANPTCPTGSSTTAPEIVTETMVCYPDDGSAAFEHEGTTCPAGSSSSEVIVDYGITCYPDDGSAAFQQMGDTCPVGSSTTAPVFTNTEQVAKIVKDTEDALIAAYGENFTEEQKAEYMALGKNAIAAFAATVDGGITVQEVAMGGQSSGATKLLDLDYTAGAANAGIDASMTDVMKTIQNEYSTGDNFGLVDDVQLYTDNLSTSPGLQLGQISLGEATAGDFGTTMDALTLANRASNTVSGTLNPLIVTDETVTNIINGLNTGSLNTQQVADAYGVTAIQVQAELDNANNATAATTPAATTLANRAADTVSGTLTAGIATSETINDLAAKINSGALTAAQVAGAYGVSEADVNAQVAAINANNAAAAATTVTTPTPTDAVGATKVLVPGEDDTFIPYNTSPYTSVDATFSPGGSFGAQPGEVDYQWGAAAQGLSEGDSSFLLGGPETATVGAGGGSAIPLGIGGYYGFNQGGSVDPMEQRSEAVGSRLLRQTGLGSLQNQTMTPEMANTLDRIMGRRK